MTIPANGFEINTLEDIERLFLSLKSEYGEVFRPNEDFFYTQNMEGDYLFGDALAEALNRAMIRCEQVCNDLGLNIYKLVDELRAGVEEES